MSARNVFSDTCFVRLPQETAITTFRYSVKRLNYNSKEFFLREWGPVYLNAALINLMHQSVRYDQALISINNIEA